MFEEQIKKYLADPPEQFGFKEIDFCGVGAFLCGPNHVGAKWDQENKIFRSLIVDENGNVLSSGFPKFTNMGENPEHFPPPETLDNSLVISKEDGSLLICDFVNGQFSMRTRGTASYVSLDSYKDFEYIRDEKYKDLPKFMENLHEYSLLFEIVTPNQRIVLDYGDEPDIYLIGAVHKESLLMVSQEQLDRWARAGGFERPIDYTFDSLDELVGFIKAGEGIEGCCIYSPDGQTIHKLKGDWYLAAHRMKSELATLDRVIDFYVKCDCPDEKVFSKIVASTFDHEIAERAEEDSKIVCEAYNKVKKLIKEIERFIELLEDYGRKEQAAKIMRSKYYKHSGVCFLVLDGKEIPEKKIIHLIKQQCDEN